MKFLISIWNGWEGLIILSITISAFAIWVNIAESQRKKKIAEEEAVLLKQFEEKRSREDALFKKFMASKKDSACNIEFRVILETYGDNVKVELRVGEIGNSFPLVIKQSNSGKLEYKELCPSKYFLAIGNDKEVSITPVQDFEKGKIYTSTVHLTSGVGNMNTLKREKI